MSGLDDSVRDRTDALDSLGNTTAATGKGFAIGSAAMTAMALTAAFITALGGSTEPTTLAAVILNPRLITGMFIGGMLPFVFSALTMRAVGDAAQSIVEEVRRQSRIDLPSEVVRIDGRVKARGDYPLEPNMHVSDLLRAGGGLQDAAYGTKAELTQASGDWNTGAAYFGEVRGYDGQRLTAPMPPWANGTEEVAQYP